MLHYHTTHPSELMLTIEVHVHADAQLEGMRTGQPDGKLVLRMGGAPQHTSARTTRDNSVGGTLWREELTPLLAAGCCVHDGSAGRWLQWHVVCDGPHLAGRCR